MNSLVPPYALRQYRASLRAARSTIWIHTAFSVPFVPALSLVVPRVAPIGVGAVNALRGKVVQLLRAPQTRQHLLPKTAALPA
eukprot:2669953-Rhodomonas_salina.1